MDVTTEQSRLEQQIDYNWSDTDYTIKHIHKIALFMSEHSPDPSS